ncbi:MAG: ATP-binding protein [Bacteroidota bacterium]
MEEFDILEFLSSKFIIAVYGTTFGLLLPFVFNDYVRPFLSSVRSIRARLQEGKPIGKREENRIKKFAKQRLQEWISKLKPSISNEGSYDEVDHFVLMKYEDEYKTTNCSSADDHIYIDSTIFVDKNLHEINANYLVDNLEKYFQQIDSVDKISKKLFNIEGVCPELIVWLRIPQFITKSKQSLDELFIKSAAVTKTWFPNSTLKIELYIPKIILKQYADPGLSKIADYEVFKKYEGFNFQFESAKITYLKDLALATLTKKTVFGKLDLDANRRIPGELIQAKIPDVRSSMFASFQLIKVTGQPGSGKTEILNYLIEHEITDSAKIITVCFNSPDEIAQLNEYFGKYESFVNYLTEIIDLDQLFDFPESDVKIVRGVLNEILKRKLVSILIVIDNLEYSETLVEDVNKLLASDKFSNVKFLLAARYLKNSGESNSKLLSIESEVWSYDESLKIISHWNGSPDMIINKPWLKANRSFSTYFLRIISTTDKDIEPDELVRKEINSILAPVLNSVESTEYSAEEQILKIKELIKDQKLKEESITEIFEEKRNLDLVKVFGNITWSRIYNTNKDGDEHGLRSNIIPERIINWSNNLIPDVKTAETLIKACKNSGVIKDYNISDKLIQDGTAAITLQEDSIRNYLLLESSGENNSEKLNEIEGVIHDLITSLAKKNSLEIFKISFRTDHLLVVINSIINSKRNKEILVELLSVDYINYLSRKPKNIEQVAFNLIQSFDKHELTTADKIILGLCLSRIIDEDTNLKAYFDELKANGQKRDLIFCVYSQILMDDLEVFELAGNVKERAILFDYCCRTWSGSPGIELFMRILSPDMEAEAQDLIASFLTWIKRHDIQLAYSICDNILVLIPDKQEVEKKILTELLVGVFEFLFRDAQEIKNEYSLSIKLREWSIIIKKLFFKRQLESSELMKMLAYGFNKELCDFNGEYRVIADKKDNKIYAIPKRQFRKAGIQSIFENFQDTTYFDLPSSKLLSYVYVKKDGKELVNDYLKLKNIPYVPFPKIYPNEHKYFEGKEVKSMTSTDINSTKFGWRPVFFI